jgi:hypothetical protein
VILRPAKVHVSFAGIALASLACGSTDLGGDDQDGIVGGNYVFELAVDDAMFTPTILKTQNVANVTLTLKNNGTKPHGFVIACMAGTCFPDAAVIEPVDPGATAMTKFQTPRAEGIYAFGSNASGDTQSGQFIIQ